MNDHGKIYGYCEDCGNWGLLTLYNGRYLCEECLDLNGYDTYTIESYSLNELQEISFTFVQPKYEVLSLLSGNIRNKISLIKPRKIKL